MLCGLRRASGPRRMSEWGRRRTPESVLNLRCHVTRTCRSIECCQWQIGRRAAAGGRQLTLSSVDGKPAEAFRRGRRAPSCSPCSLCTYSFIRLLAFTAFRSAGWSLVSARDEKPSIVMSSWRETRQRQSPSPLVILAGGLGVNTQHPQGAGLPPFQPTSLRLRTMHHTTFVKCTRNLRETLRTLFGR